MKKKKENPMLKQKICSKSLELKKRNMEKQATEEWMILWFKKEILLL